MNMARNSLKLIFLGLLFVFLASCQEGLEPPSPDEKSFIGGQITFVGGSENWPPEDSVFAVRVVAFKDYPPKDIMTELLSGNAYFTMESLPFYVDNANYSIEITDTPVTIEYIAVALQFTDAITSQIAIGVYTVTGDRSQPTPVEILRGQTINDLDIEVDFDNLPPQPF